MGRLLATAEAAAGASGRLASAAAMGSPRSEDSADAGQATIALWELSREMRTTARLLHASIACCAGGPCRTADRRGGRHCDGAWPRGDLGVACLGPGLALACAGSCDR